MHVYIYNHAKATCACKYIPFCVCSPSFTELIISYACFNANSCIPIQVLFKYPSKLQLFKLLLCFVIVSEQGDAVGTRVVPGVKLGFLKREIGDLQTLQ